MADIGEIVIVYYVICKNVIYKFIYIIKPSHQKCVVCFISMYNVLRLYVYLFL